jgi:D-lactate dehydrogenase
MNKTVFHFDAYSDFVDLLEGVKFGFPLNVGNLDKVESKEQIEVVTVKSSSRIDAGVLAAFPNLKLLITRTVGTDHIDVDACEKRGIEVKNIPDYGAFSVAEHVFALLLSLTRKVIEMDRRVKSGVFDAREARGFSLEGKVMGVVGSGRIGVEVIKLAKAFKMKVVVFDMFENKMLSKSVGFEYVSKDELLKNADVISLSVPLTPETRHMIGREEIDLMKDGVILINTARGAVVDTQALIEMIDKFMYVGLDVLEDEENFDMDNPLLKFDKVVITPHCAFFTDRSVKKIVQRTRELVEEYLDR